MRPLAPPCAQALFEILRELGPTHTNQQLAEHLNQTGWLTVSRRPFTEESVRWMRWKHRIPSPSPLRENELDVHELAKRLDVGDHVIYVWIRQGKLRGRRAGRRRLAIPFNDEIEAACRQRLADGRLRDLRRSRRLRARRQRATSCRAAPALPCAPAGSRERAPECDLEGSSPFARGDG